MGLFNSKSTIKSECNAVQLNLIHQNVKPKFATNVLTVFQKNPTSNQMFKVHKQKDQITVMKVLTLK